MKKLSEYKSAEKSAKDLVSDYEQMKMKYFNVLTENQSQKTQLQEIIQSNLQKDINIKTLGEDKQKLKIEISAIQRELSMNFEELSTKNKMINQLQEEFGRVNLKA